MIQVTITIPDDERLAIFLMTGARVASRVETWSEADMTAEQRQILAAAHVKPDGTISVVKAEAAPLYHLFTGTVLVTFARPPRDVGEGILALARSSAVAYR